MESIIITDIDIYDAVDVLGGTDTPNYVYNDKAQKILSLPKYDEARVHIEGTLNLVAKDIYGDERLAWIISVYNGMTDSDIIPGAMISYPKLESVREVLKL